jgi:predicted HicB family RNase H-like nuclease
MEKVFFLCSFSVVSKDGVPFRDPLGGQKEFSGKFVLRIDPALHRRLAAKALASGESLNAFCANALGKQ